MNELPILRRIVLHGGPFDGGTHDLVDSVGSGDEPHVLGLPIEGVDRVAWYSRAQDIETREGLYVFYRIEPRYRP